MANESTLRSYRDFDAYHREGYTTESAPRREGGDPLAELARIMGQDQGYADLLKSAARTRTEPSFDALDAATAELRGSAPASDNVDWDELEAQLETYQRSETTEPDTDREWDEDQAAELERLLAEEHQRSEATRGLAYGAAAGAAVAGAAVLAHRAGRGQAEAQPAQAQYAQPAYAAESYEGRAPALHPANDYDEAPPRRRSAGMTAIAAVLALAVVGGGSVMAYRAMKGGGSAGGEPRIVRANPEPVRVAAQQAQEAAPAAATRASGERMVPREERPVSAREQAAQVQQPPAPSRVIPLIPPQGAPAGVVTDPGAAPPVRTVAAVPVASPPPAAPMTTAAPAPAMASAPMPNRRPAEEPRRVRTVQVGPDGNFLTPPPAPRPQAPQQQALSVVPGAPSPSLAAANSRTAPAPRPAPQAAPAAAPLSIAPQQQPQRTAALHTASVRTPAAAAPAPAAGGTFVQISSHQTEAEARSAFASAQRRYPLLQGQAANIRTAEIAGRGTWHRLRVGPFSREGAQDFCQRLKASGGSCVLN